MKLIVGLGNPGEKYASNRHNVGHMVVDKIKNNNIRIKNATTIKTNTFMNDSGTSVKELLSKNNVSPENLYIIHDDLDLPLGSWKMQLAKGPKDNGGINSIEQVLGTENFWRIRVGIDNRNPEKRTSGEEYVLEDFTEDEKDILDKVINDICKKLETF
jgi:peptidyl-tRNA hydrolase, PTH1 family